jgi:hypothetical protein
VALGRGGAIWVDRRERQHYNPRWIDKPIRTADQSNSIWPQWRYGMLNDPVSVAQYQAGAAVAEVTRSVLEAAGIPAFTAGLGMGELLGWVRVYVSAGDRERAEAVIADMETTRLDREALDEDGPCLACGRPMTAELCRSCGWSWLDDGEEAEDVNQT